MCFIPYLPPVRLHPQSTTTVLLSIHHGQIDFANGKLLRSAPSAAGLVSSAALASTALSCPASNGTSFSNSTAGTTYTIECGIDRYDNDLGLVYVPTLDSCIAACNDNPKCVDVSWVSLRSTEGLFGRPLT